MTSDKFAAMIGFAKRAGKIVYGYDNIKKAKGLKLIAVSDSASDNLKSAMERLKITRHIPTVYARSLEEVVGGNCKALGITDPNMAKAMLEYASDAAPLYRT